MHYSIAVVVPSETNAELWVEQILEKHKYNRWDWYVIGGRWNNYFQLHDGTECNVARVGDIDWAGMSERNALLAAERWDNQAYRRWITETREQYIWECSRQVPFGIVDAKGVWLDWYEFAEDLDGWIPAFEDVLDEFSEDDLLVLVDVHN